MNTAAAAPVSTPRRQGLLDMLAWAIADGRHPDQWWAEQLGLDEVAFAALLEGEEERLLRARMLNATAHCTDGKDVARALRGRVLELLAGAPKAGALAAAALTLRRLPDWAVKEWNDVASRAGSGVEPGWPETPEELASLQAAMAEAKAMLIQLDEDEARKLGWI